MNKAWAHFKTITRHRHTVMRHCFKAGIPLQGLLHDLSKYTPSEFLQGAKYYQGTRSPNEREREENGFSRAWVHHKGRNKHHFEYWTDYNIVTHTLSGVEMPVKYVAEMFCDRIAASKIYRGDEYKQSDPLMYFERAKSQRMIHPRTHLFLEQLLKVLAQRGEDAAFKFLRAQVRTGHYPPLSAQQAAWLEAQMPAAQAAGKRETVTN